MLKEIKISPCWILCYPRTGSSYLCELLNKTMLFPFYNNSSISRSDYFLKKDNGRAFDEWLRLFQNKKSFLDNIPNFLKAINHQFFDLCNDCDISQIKKTLPNIKFIHLHRKNKINQAVSLFLAEELDAYHIFTKNSLFKHNDTKINCNYQKLINCYKKTKEYKSWCGFLKNENYLEVYYESFLENPNLVLSNIFKFLNLPQINFEDSIKNANKFILKTSHPQKKEFEDWLENYVNQQDI